MEMKGFELLHQGAEARLYVGNYLGKPTIIKERFVKTYRHPELDNNLMKERIKAESRAIIRCKNVGVLTPALYLVDFNRRSIFMEYFTSSITAKEFISKSNSNLIEKLSLEIGKVLAKMHMNNIIHGDLTTSNILLVNKNNKPEYFNNYEDLNLIIIDFGLSHVDSSAEDKGVDLYVLERALLSTHNTGDQIFINIMSSYKKHYKNCKEIFKKYDEVKARGRKRTMVG